MMDLIHHPFQELGAHRILRIDARDVENAGIVGQDRTYRIDMLASCVQKDRDRTLEMIGIHACLGLKPQGGIV